MTMSVLPRGLPQDGTGPNTREMMGNCAGKTDSVVAEDHRRYLKI